MDQLLACLVSVAEENTVNNFQSPFSRSSVRGLHLPFYYFMDHLLACLVSVAEVSRCSACDKLLREICGCLFLFFFKGIGANLQRLVVVRSTTESYNFPFFSVTSVVSVVTLITFFVSA
jgi:hypothetical protein